jgi:hypothetical protein
MRSSLVLAGCCAAALSWSGSVDALSPETTCENIKLRAAGGYARCVARAAREANATGADLSDEAVERCNRRFDQVFEFAEAIGTCRTAGGPSSLRGPILGQMTETLAATTTGPGCPSAPVLTGDTYVCTLTSASAIDLAEVLAQIDEPDLNLESIVWIEAWGATGAAGDHGGNGGTGGSGGYAQTTTTVSDPLTSFGTTEYFYYLGKPGPGGGGAGGTGGTATVITANDLTSSDPEVDMTLMIAGGGGGGGSGSTGGNCSGARDVLGGGGGAAGGALAGTGADAYAAGLRGGSRRNSNHSGDGGGGTSAGAGGASGGGEATAGHAGIAALGGPGGKGGGGTLPVNGFANQTGVKITASGGAGGGLGDDAGGGGGGGGFGGGGGGAEGDGSTNCVSGGGGGGGSMAKASTRSCTRSQPSNPNNATGSVQIVFQVGPCD